MAFRKHSTELISHRQEPRGVGIRDIPRGHRSPGGGAAHGRIDQELAQGVRVG